MVFELKNTVPWGRNLEEYRSMFNLTDFDLNHKIISFGDGPASFNSELSYTNKNIVSIDPIYEFSQNEIKLRIEEIKDIVLEQTKNNFENFVWARIKSIKELEEIRMLAMETFLQDFEIGKSEKRYLNHSLPNQTDFDDLTFDLGLSSHFLILYSQLGLDFHIASINEMLRVAKEIRIFPLLNLNSKRSEVLDDLVNYYEKEFIVSIKKVNYEFQRNGNEMLTIKRKQ
ncbi:hypothetical protein OZ668_15230 [Elizabethkingia sp. HX XZB]|uniref:hypothetical protein n=1 Tax=Elizabethkingia sp. HX XZB TaxID=3003193 RepID=UPI002A24D039|nr:hypothetical protein [Elizabethkingia sp. HX XZB]MDX8569352.1 hypothetical protein [Elizabethkingia sp. HX XZB]